MLASGFNYRDLKARLIVKRIIPTILLIGLIFTFFGGIPTAHAQSIFKGDNVPAGEFVDQNVVLFGDKVVVDGTVEGDVLAIGKDVIVNGPIKGSLIVLALSSEVKSSIGGSFYAGLLRKLVLRSEASIAKDLYMAGTEISTEPEALHRARSHGDNPRRRFEG